MRDLPQTSSKYSSVHVVSDLHLGGFDGELDGKPRNYRIFRESEALAWLIDEVGRKAAQAEERAALVLNGDIVDFLAVEGASHFDTRSAAAKLEGIIEDRDQKPVWEALRRYVRESGGDLVIVLGNHDVELALPSCRKVLLEYLFGDDEKPGSNRGRVLFAVDGAGFSCEVGGAHVLCVHGNEVDDWNVIDHGALTRVIRAIQRDAEQPRFPINGGTTLVIDVMNGLKRKYQWIDLLKPEREHASVMLARVAPEIGAALKHVGHIVYPKLRDRARMYLRLLGDDESADQAEEEQQRKRSAFEARIDAAMGGAGSPVASPAEQLVVDAFDAVSRGEDPLDLVPLDDRMLGDERGLARRVADAVGRAVDLTRVRFEEGRLREVLERDLVERDASFSPSSPDDGFERLDAAVGPSVDFLVAGHSHLEKALKREHGTGYYYNTGTWISVLRLPAEALEEQRFGAVVAAFEEGSLEALDALRQGKGGIDLAMTRRTVACIESLGGGRTRGALLHVVEDQAGALSLEVVADTERVVDRS